MRKNLLAIFPFILLILSVFGELNMDMIGASAVEYPAIMVVPEVTLDETLTPGKNFTIAIYTDYSDTFQATDMWTGDDVRKSFDTTHISVVIDSEEVYVNEILMTKPADYTMDYTMGNITFTTAPGVGANVTAIYLYGDVWSYDFSLSYNPNVLYGGINITNTWTGDGTSGPFYTTQKPILEYSEKVYVNGTLMTRDVDYFIVYEIGGIMFTGTVPGVGAEIKATYLYDGVVNGDLITTDKYPDAKFSAGTFNNTLGKLSTTTAYFLATEKPVPKTYGPGILANVTFTVVGYGTSYITLGEKDTKIWGYNETTDTPYKIIDANYEPEHIQHGFFSNKILGDVNGDEVVDVFDLFDLNKAYGSELGDLNWNSDCDFNRDNKVDASDLFDLSKNYGRSI